MSRSAKLGVRGSGDDPPLGRPLDFLRLVWALEHALETASKRMEGSLGVTVPQRAAIRIVGRFPGISAARVASILHLDPSTLTGVLGRLRRRGFVTRRLDPRDRRRATFGLTPAGRRLDVGAGDVLEDAVRATLAPLGAAEVAAAEDTLRRLAASLDATGIALARSPRRPRRHAEGPALLC